MHHPRVSLDVEPRDELDQQDISTFSPAPPPGSSAPLDIQCTEMLLLKMLSSVEGRSMGDALGELFLRKSF